MVEKFAQFLADHPAYLVTFIPEILAILLAATAKTPENQTLFELVAIIMPLIATGVDRTGIIRPRY